MSLQTELAAAVAQTAVDGQLLHQIVHGDDQSQVQTDGGPVKTVAKAITDIDAQLQSSLVELDQKVADAAISEANAAASETNAALSEGNASTSAVNAATSETNVAASEVNAEAHAIAVKRALAWQVGQAMEEEKLSKTAMAKRMHTSRAALDRFLDPENSSVTLLTMDKAAVVLGKRLRVELIDEVA